MTTGRRLLTLSRVLQSVVPQVMSDLSGQLSDPSPFIFLTTSQTKASNRMVVYPIYFGGSQVVPNKHFSSRCGQKRQS